MNINNEILNLLLKIGVGIEIITAVIGTFYYYKYKEVRVLNLFVYLLWYVVFNELIGYCIREYTERAENALFHNIYNVINFTYLLILYRYNLSIIKYRKILSFFIISYLVAFIINGFFENYLSDFQRLPYILAALYLVISIFFYFQDILNSNRVLNARKSLLFWISVGLLIYFVGILPFRIMRNYYSELTDFTIYFLVIFSLTVIMNICFIIGFIWSDKKQRY